MTLRVQKGQLFITFGILLYILVLNLSYVFAISPVFSYMGYVVRPVSLLAFTSMGVLSFLPSFWLPIKAERPSQVVCWLLYVFVFVPVMIVPFYTLQLPERNIIVFNGLCCLAFILLNQVYKLPLFSISKSRLGVLLTSFFVAALVVLLYAYVFLTFGFSFRITSLLDVYDVRSDYKTELSGNRFSAYIVGWLANAINPFLIGFGLVYRRNLFIILGIMGQVILFSITGFKSVFFSFLLILALLFALRRRGKFMGPTLIGGAIAVVCFAFVLDWLVGSHVYTSLFVRRMIITPGLLTGFYFEFFGDQPKALLAHSIFRGFFDYPYDVTPPFLIGRAYFNNVAASANANFLADAFANFGYFGLFLFTTVLGLILWFVDSLTSDLDIRLPSLMLAIPAYSLSNSGLLTTLLTHGMLFTILLILLVPSLVESPRFYKSGKKLDVFADKPKAL
jgi:hypothetical protein